MFELEADTIDMQGYDILIGRDWLYQVNPDIQWNTTCWCYWNASSTKIKIHHTTCFSKIVCGQEAHLLLITTLSEETPDETIPSEYSDYADIFSATEASKLPNTQVTHDIDLFPGKELPWKLIYPMSAIELETLQKYLYEEQAKG